MICALSYAVKDVFYTNGTVAVNRKTSHTAFAILQIIVKGLDQSGFRQVFKATMH